MNILDCKNAIQFQLHFTLRTNLLLLTGEGSETLDNTIDVTPEKKLHINGYVWAGLFRRALARIQGGHELAARIGKYSAEKEGVSPMWTEASFVEVPIMDTRPGIAVSRRWKAVKSGALFNEEIAPPGLAIPARFNFFLRETDNAEEILRHFQSALWVIDDGIENIGGGWSYGFGRLKFERGTWQQLDLTRKQDRRRLFSFSGPGTPLEAKAPEAVLKPWRKILIHAGVWPNQLMAVHTSHPLMDAVIGGSKLPDAFVFQ